MGHHEGFPGGSAVKNWPTVQKWVHSLGWENPLEEGMATESSILARKIPWTEEPGGLQSMGSQRVKTRMKWLSMHAWACHEIKLGVRGRKHLYYKEQPKQGGKDPTAPPPPARSYWMGSSPSTQHCSLSSGPHIVPAYTNGSLGLVLLNMVAARPRLPLSPDWEVLLMYTTHWIATISTVKRCQVFN